MSDAALTAFGKQERELVYPLTYYGDGKPSVSAFSIQLEEARTEWRGEEKCLRQMIRSFTPRATGCASRSRSAHSERHRRSRKAVSKKPSVELLAELIASEFDELNQ